MNQLFQITRTVLMLASLTGVADASRVDIQGGATEGYNAGLPAEGERKGDRRYADLARVDRKRREDVQQQATGASAVRDVQEREASPASVELLLAAHALHGGVAIARPDSAR